VTVDLFNKNEVKAEWLHPTEFPSMKGRQVVAIDLETCDTDLKKMGPGWPRKVGKVIGIALSSGDFTAYYPIAHDGGGNMDSEVVLKYIKSICEDESIQKVFHNAQYDIGWLSVLNIEVKGYIHDTMIAAALLNENRFSYTLNSIVSEYLGGYKDEKVLKAKAEELGIDPKAEMYKLPAEFVGEYAEADALLTFRLHEKLMIEIKNDALETVYDTECRLIRVIFNMTKRGVRVDMQRAFELKRKLQVKEKNYLKRIKDITGSDVQVWAARSVAQAFDDVNLEYPRTALGAPSFTQTFLETHKHELPRMITKARVLNKLQGTFVDGIAKYIHNDRLHAHINQIRGDSGGTVTGRFSMYAPNLQQMPIRNEFGSELRKIFIPEQGEYWLSADYSQQEPRILTHFAILNKNEGAEDVQDAFIKGLDFHKQTAEMAGIPRRLAKTIGLGVMYGMGYKKLAVDLDISPAEAKEMLKEFRIKVPFMQGMLEDVMNRANKVGTIRTYLGRKCRFDLYEPSWYDPGVFHKALPLKQAQAEYGGQIKRAGTYKALNRLIQGTAADQTKKAMVDVYENLGIIPLIQVHDELNCSVKSDKEAENIKDIMENSMKLKVPSKVDFKIKDNWGDAK
jgi:DNA polymerase I-like protein with 3'-5' exonuclease and polymerase domains